MNQSQTKQFNFYFQKPQELPAEYLNAIYSLIIKVGSVGTKKWVRHNLEHAFLIGYVLESGQIIGCSTLKHPRKEYVETVKKQCGINLSGYLERGYTSVLPEYRGKKIASQLLAGLTSRIKDYKLYSAIDENNIGGQKIALNNRTKKIALYKSPSSNKKIGIWMPEKMIP